MHPILVAGERLVSLGPGIGMANVRGELCPGLSALQREPACAFVPDINVSSGRARRQAEQVPPLHLAGRPDGRPFSGQHQRDAGGHGASA